MNFNNLHIRQFLPEIGFRGACVKGFAAREDTKPQRKLEGKQMKEIEKRLGLDSSDSDDLKAKLNQRLEPDGSIGRTVLVKIEGDSFTPDPDTQIDVKVKLIGEASILSIKHGSWHGDAERTEYDVNFDRTDLAEVIGGMSVFGYTKFVLLSTLRTTWQEDELVYTLDEYRNAGPSLFEVEATGSAGEDQVDQAFTNLGITPMDSEATVVFISSINANQSMQFDLTSTVPTEVATHMLEVHRDAD